MTTHELQDFPHLSQQHSLLVQPISETVYPSDTHTVFPGSYPKRGLSSFSLAITSPSLSLDVILSLIQLKIAPVLGTSWETMWVWLRGKPFPNSAVCSWLLQIFDQKSWKLIIITRNKVHYNPEVIHQIVGVNEHICCNIVSLALCLVGKTPVVSSYGNPMKKTPLLEARNECKGLIEESGGRWVLAYLAVRVWNQLAVKVCDSAFSVTNKALERFVAGFERPIGGSEAGSSLDNELNKGTDLQSWPPKEDMLMIYCVGSWVEGVEILAIFIFRSFLAFQELKVPLLTATNRRYLNRHKDLRRDVLIRTANIKMELRERDWMKPIVCPIPSGACSVAKTSIQPEGEVNISYLYQRLNLRWAFGLFHIINLNIASQ